MSVQHNKVSTQCRVKGASTVMNLLVYHVPWTRVVFAATNGSIVQISKFPGFWNVT